MILTAPEILEILQTDLMNGQKACSRIDRCPPPAPGPITPSFVSHPSNLSDLSGEKPWPSWQADHGTGYILHITDLHIVSDDDSSLLFFTGRPACTFSSDHLYCIVWNRISFIRKVSTVTVDCHYAVGSRMVGERVQTSPLANGAPTRDVTCPRSSSRPYMTS